jgi:metalloendopeptidase OMA1, mitochondrial
MRKLLFVPFVCLAVGCVTTPETGRKAFILTSEAEENQLGVQAFQEVLSKERVSNNARWTAILNRVGQRVAAAANQPDFKWEFRLIESKEKNAFCLPGGKVAFYTGIFGVAENEGALAAVMGHEVAHATARHAGQRMTLAFGTQLAFEGFNAILGGGNTTQKKLLLAALGVGSQLGAALPFSRANESEADEIGLLYMSRAGYDPNEAVLFWQRMAAGGGGMPRFLSTHPPSEERSQALMSQMPRVVNVYDRSSKYGKGETL